MERVECGAEGGAGRFAEDCTEVNVEGGAKGGVIDGGVIDGGANLGEDGAGGESPLALRVTVFRGPTETEQSDETSRG